MDVDPKMSHFKDEQSFDLLYNQVGKGCAGRSCIFFFHSSRTRVEISPRKYFISQIRIASCSHPLHNAQASHDTALCSGNLRRHYYRYGKRFIA